ncbi:HD-GYP domain-containing protein [Bdellovibrionota bacterium FG-2]
MGAPKLNSPISPVATWDEVPVWADSVAQTLLQALKERDPYTFGHSLRVAHHASLLSKAAGLNEFEQRIVAMSSMFHDLGKLGIPDSILLKPARLSAHEEALMHEHPRKSAEILAPLSHVPFFRSTLPGIRHHHERMDGEGYPDRIKGENIPLTARIILIADTFDAMTTNRPYRKGLATETAYKELKQFSGRQFDSHLVKIFLGAHPEWISYEESISDDFVAARFRRAA